jgi:hypothetical protein
MAEEVEAVGSLNESRGADPGAQGARRGPPIVWQMLT